VISCCEEFSEDCINLANENNVRLINGLDFAEMILDVGLENLEDALIKK
jgi:hypothetical protein